MPEAGDDSELWSEILPKFVRVPLAVYRNRVRIERWWKKGLVAISRGGTNVVVLGRAGVGKSVLAQRLNGLPAKIQWRPPPQSRWVEPAVLDVGNHPKIVRVIPGQTSLERDEGLREALGSHGKIQGVIYVVDWGFTDERDQTAKSVMIRQQGLTTMDAVRNFNQDRELRDFEIVCDRIRDSVTRLKCPHWIMIAVNKADLFIKDIDKAHLYYHPSSGSAFTAPLKALRNFVGEMNLRCDAAPISVWGESFEWSGEMVPTSLAEAEARKLLENFVQRLDALARPGGV